jgi:hypothetical protein
MVIVIYTHTDTKDVWVPFFDRMKKYMSQYKTYICVNKDDVDIPNEYHKIYYDDSKAYTNRLIDSFYQIQEEVIMFTHEDMILYNTPNYDYLDKYSSYVENRIADSIKLIPTSNKGQFTKSDIDDTLAVDATGDFHKFSIQPTIIRKSILEEMAKGCGSVTIWQFELAIVGAGLDFVAYKGDEQKRGLYHYDSFVYPYIATAIVKGKWNTLEYQKELSDIFAEYNINPFQRGIV